MDDSIDETDETFEVRGATPEAGLTVSASQVTITDDDTAGITVSRGALSVTEGGSRSYTVVLDTQPTGDVTIDITGHSNTDLTLSDTELTFTPEGWNSPQTVTVTAANDDDSVPDPAVTLSHDASGGDYGGVGAQTVEVTIEEDDTVGLTVDPTALTVTEGSSDTYTVVLDTQPTGDVTVTVSGHFETDITLSGETLTNNVLTFTPDNWNVAQTIIVSADQDDDAAADVDGDPGPRRQRRGLRRRRRPDRRGNHRGGRHGGAHGGPHGVDRHRGEQRHLHGGPGHPAHR